MALKKVSGVTRPNTGNGRVIHFLIPADNLTQELFDWVVKVADRDASDYLQIITTVGIGKDDGTRQKILTSSKKHSVAGFDIDLTENGGYGFPMLIKSFDRPFIVVGSGSQIDYLITSTREGSYEVLQKRHGGKAGKFKSLRIAYPNGL